MSYKNISIAMQADEQTFVNTFINAVVDKSENRITCPDFENFNASATNASFTLKFDNTYTLRFQRNPSSCFYSLYDSNNTVIGSLYYSDQNGINSNKRISRTWNFKLAINHQILMLNLYPLKSLTSSRDSFSLISLDADDYYGISIIKNNNLTNSVNNAITGQFLLTNKDTNQTFRAYCCNRLRYTYDAQDDQAIEIIKSKTFCSPGPINGPAYPRVLTLNSVFDCSYCVPDTLLTVDNKQYYVLSNYSLMQVGGPTTEILTQGNITSLDRNVQSITIADTPITQTRLQTTTSNMEIVQNPISDS